MKKSNDNWAIAWKRDPNATTLWEEFVLAERDRDKDIFLGDKDFLLETEPEEQQEEIQDSKEEE